MSKYICLKIPFGTKNYIKRKSTKMVTKGVAYFIFDVDLGKYIDEYIQIEKSTYRCTDLDMIKPTDYYKDVRVQEFRNNYLNQYSKINPHDIQKGEQIFLELKTNEINEVNEYFIKSSMTIRSQFALLSGSNFSGAETDNRSSQILCIDNLYAGCNFANPIKHFNSNKKAKTKLYSLSNNEIFLIEDFMKIEYPFIEEFRNLFFKYNQDYVYSDVLPDEILEIEDNHISKTYDVIKSTLMWKPKNNQMDYIDAFINKTIDNYDELINSKNLKQRLRSFYNSNVKNAISNKYIPLHSTIKKINLKTIENAHIIEFSSLVNNNTVESLCDAINPYNCLRIDSNIHKLIDDGIYKFDLKGNLINSNGDVKPYLDIKNMPEQTKYFLERYVKAN